MVDQGCMPSSTGDDSPVSSTVTPPHHILPHHHHHHLPAVSPSASPPSSAASSHDDSLTTVAEDEPVSIDKTIVPLIGVPHGPKIIEVKCGPLHAKMHVEQFLCPGIHQPCIELDGEMISPKEFTVRANKDKQKDWKGSIRIGKSNLRSLMEMRTFDFYNHTLFCSAKCQSRNYITPKSASSMNHEKTTSSSSASTTSSDSDKDSSRRSSKSSIEQLIALQIASASASPPKPNFGYGYTHDSCDSLSQFVHLNQSINNNNNNNPNNINNNLHHHSMVKEETFESDSLPPPPPVLPTADHITQMMRTQPGLFWSQLSHVGLLDDVIDIVQHEVDSIRNSAKQGTNPSGKAVEGLCRVALSLQLSEQIAARVRTRQFQHNTNIQQEMDRKRRLEPYPNPLGNMKRPCLQYSDMLLMPKNETKTEFVPSSNSAFSMPTPNSQMELLLKLAALHQMQQSHLAPGTLGAPGAPQLPPPSAYPPPVEQAHFNAQLTEALLKMQSAQTATQ